VLKQATNLIHKRYASLIKNTSMGKKD